MPRFCAATIAAMLVIGAATLQADDDEAALTAELEPIAATVWQAVLARDVETLLRHASPFDDADAGHGSLVVEQAIEHHALMLDFARRVLEGR
jgi:hypothetical protein